MKKNLPKNKNNVLPLRENNYERYHNLIENLGVGITIHTPDGSIVMHNIKATELLWLLNDETKGIKLVDPHLKFLTEDSEPLPNIEHPVERTITRCESVRNQIIGVTHPATNQITWLLVNTFPSLNKEGELLEIITSYLDISELREAEILLRKSEERYRNLSILDDLTGLYNRRHFYDQLKMETDRANRYGQPLTLLMLDIDDFKIFNDTHGHLEGDKLLIWFGKIIKKCLRQTDTSYRYGGEEFMIILPITTIKEGVHIAKKIRDRLKKEITITNSGQKVRTTVSVGVAQYKPHKELRNFVKKVDQLMYSAKREGKDRVFHENLTLPE